MDAKSDLTAESHELGSGDRMPVLASGGVAAFNEEQAQHGEATISLFRYVTTSQFWFESLQNWQSEFIAVAAIEPVLWDEYWRKSEAVPEDRLAVMHRAAPNELRRGKLAIPL